VLTAFVPGVALYRAIETTSCVDDMSLLDCHSELICWRHDLERYRYLTHAVTAAFHAAAVLLFTVALFLSPASEAPDAADEQPVSRSRRNTAVHISNSAEPRTPVICNDDVMTGASPASQSLEHSESVHDTHM